MHIYLVRHGIAEEELEAYRAGKKDSERSLTPEGFERTRKVANSFAKRISGVQKIFHSPYLRAEQTAKIFSEALGVTDLEETPHFRPHDSIEEAKEIIFNCHGIDSCMFVGHEPHLGNLLSLLLTGKTETHFTFKKAGIAGLEINATGSCSLQFFVSPKILLP